MTDKQKAILDFLSKFKSATMEQIVFFTKCSIQDIKELINLKYIIKDEKTNLLRHRVKHLDVRTAVALDVIKDIYKDVKDFKYSIHHPIILTALTKDNLICDIAVVRSIEQNTVFEKLDTYTKADKIIIVLDSENYDKKRIKTKKEVLICTYPIKIIGTVN